jgi:tetratricopeptide (TPR) repeat protein
LADQTKQTMIGGRGNTQIIGVPYQDFIAEMRRKDAEIARLTNDLTDALKNASDPQEKDDLQSRLDALRQKRDALKIRLSDPERAFNEHMQRGTQLAQILADTAQRHAIGENRINSAMEAFESFSYDEVKELFRESERLGRVQAASSAFALGMIEEDALNWQDALDHYERAYGQDPTFDHLQAYARLCWEMGRWRDAVPLFEKILKQVAQDSGEQGAEYAEALNDLALVLKNLGEYTQAEPLYEQALGIYRRVLGDDHPDTAISLNNLAELYRAQGHFAQAEPLLKEAVEIAERVLGGAHPNTKIFRENYEDLLAQMKN